MEGKTTRLSQLNWQFLEGLLSFLELRHWGEAPPLGYNPHPSSLFPLGAETNDFK